MVIKSAEHEITAVRPEQYPVKGLPEIAFVGRSNVGKSSIINSLVNRKSLARVGGKPGKTREIQFYNINGSLYLVDLPGYGYAGVSKDQKDAWASVVDTYLLSRNQLKLIIMMVDIRHAPSEDDKLMYEWLAASDIAFVVVASKADKVSRSKIQGSISEIRNGLGMNKEIKVLPYSSESGYGRDELWTELERGACQN